MKHRRFSVIFQLISRNACQTASSLLYTDTAIQLTAFDARKIGVKGQPAVSMDLSGVGSENAPVGQHEE